MVSEAKQNKTIFVMCGPVALLAISARILTRLFCKRARPANPILHTHAVGHWVYLDLGTDLLCEAPDSPSLSTEGGDNGTNLKAYLFRSQTFGHQFWAKSISLNSKIDTVLYCTQKL